MDTTKSRELRGSQKLLDGLAKNGEMPSVEEIKRALSLPHGAQLRIPNWRTHGLPPAYLAFDATIEAPIEQLSDVLKSFINLNDSTIGFRIFPRGIPFIDGVTIEVTNTEME